MSFWSTHTTIATTQQDRAKVQLFLICAVFYLLALDQMGLNQNPATVI
jgi:hypothetical protein